MQRNVVAALLLAVVVAAGAGAFVVGSQSAGPTVRSVELLDTECDDGSYESALEERPADGGTEIVVEDTYVGPAPNSTLDATLSKRSENYTLTLAATGETDGESACAGELHYRAVVFLPSENFDLTVVHGDESHAVLQSDENGSSASSSASA